MGYLSADTVGSAVSEISCAYSGSADRGSTESGNPLAQRSTDPLLLGPAGARNAQEFDWLGEAEGYCDRMDSGDATPPRQRLERTLYNCRDGRGAAAQKQLPDPRQETLQPAVGRAPSLGKPDLHLACLEHSAGGFQHRSGMVCIDRKDVHGPAEQAIERIGKHSHHIAGPIKTPEL